MPQNKRLQEQSRKLATQRQVFSLKNDANQYVLISQCAQLNIESISSSLADKTSRKRFLIRFLQSRSGDEAFKAAFVKS